MTPEEKKVETRFKCPNCQNPIVSRLTYCKQCETIFGRDTLFSCPRCGALVKQLERQCPGCGARLTDWGVGAEWLNAPVPAVQQEPKAQEKIEPGPRISKPLPELGPVISKPLPETPIIQKPSPEPAPVISKPLPEPKRPEKVEPKKPAPEPLMATGPRKLTREEQLGRTNGLKRGRINGTKQGLVNGTKRGLVNGTKQGRVNGFKGIKVGEVEEEQPFLTNKIGGKVPMWEALTAVLVVIVLVSSAVVLSIQPGAGPTGIVIDGKFSDWASISSYRLSDVLPGNIPQIIEAKMNVSGDELCIYLRLQDNAFSGSTPSSFYVLIDADADVNTGYLLTDHQLGADRLVTLAGWDGHLMETIDCNFTDQSDSSNWSAWTGLYYTSAIQSLSEVEMSIPVCSGEPLVQIMTVGAGMEFNTPIMSNQGVIVAKQTSLLTGGVATSASQSVLQLSVRAMGVPAGNYSVTATISNETGTDLASQIIQVSPSSWTTVDFAVNLSSLGSGESFSVMARLSSTEFIGPLDVDGDPITGYYLSAPSSIIIDGVFGDWVGRKVADTDTMTVANPNIDIVEVGADSENNSHFFYARVAGEALGGANIPEERAKPSGGGGGPPVIRLKKTGEDLLQAFIDRDPGNMSGKIVVGGGKTIGADYLVEIFGRKGHATARSVMEWSSATMEWIHLGPVEKIGVGGPGIEFSVAKSLLGNLTGSEVIFFTTDWKERTDDCWLNGALKDPWVITSAGASYESLDGITWASSGSITLQGSGSNADTKIVDMVSNVNRIRVWAVSDHGRIYTNVTGSNTWTSNLTIDLLSAANGKPSGQGYPISDVIAIAAYPFGAGEKIFLLTQRGYTYVTKSTINEGSSGVLWDNNSQRVASFADFDDVWYANPASTTSNFYAMRSTTNTPLYWAPLKTAFTATTATGATSMNQTHIAVYPGATQATDAIYVLCDHGTIQRSTNGGTSWAAFGNLEHPNGTNASTVYVGITLDPSNIIWVVTNNGYVYKSTVAFGGTFVKTKYLGYTGIVAIVGLHSIPEFSDVLIPILTMVIPAAIITRNRRRRQGGSDRDEEEP